MCGGARGGRRIVLCVCVVVLPWGCGSYACVAHCDVQNLGLLLVVRGFSPVFELLFSVIDLGLFSLRFHQGLLSLFFDQCESSLLLDLRLSLSFFDLLLSLALLDLDSFGLLLWRWDKVLARGLLGVARACVVCGCVVFGVLFFVFRVGRVLGGSNLSGFLCVRVALVLAVVASCLCRIGRGAECQAVWMLGECEAW